MKTSNGPIVGREALNACYMMLATSKSPRICIKHAVETWLISTAFCNQFGRKDIRRITKGLSFIFAYSPNKARPFMLIRSLVEPGKFVCPLMEYRQVDKVEFYDGQTTAPHLSPQAAQAVPFPDVHFYHDASGQPCLYASSSKSPEMIEVQDVSCFLTLELCGMYGRWRKECKMQVILPHYRLKHVWIVELRLLPHRCRKALSMISKVSKR